MSLCLFRVWSTDVLPRHPPFAPLFFLISSLEAVRRREWLEVYVQSGSKRGAYMREREG